MAIPTAPAEIMPYRRSRLRTAGLVLLIGIGLLAAGAAIRVLVTRTEARDRQAGLQPFYDPPTPLPSTPGTLIRSEPLGVPWTSIRAAAALRILYVTELPDGTPAASSGMVFIPSGPVPAGGRPVVAWAHPTVGFGVSCVPSRAEGQYAIEGWLQEMLDDGWVVVATDYVAMGTPGTPLYLVGASEARDVVNSVRAARQVAGADAGTRWGVWGHSQGGHAALWTGALAASLAPELQLVGVAAAAPAAELSPLITQQWSNVVSWVIGPPVAVSWPIVHPGVTLESVVTRAGISNYERLAYECIKPAAMEGLVRSEFKETFFAIDPMTDPAWTAAATAETPPALSPELPLFLAQGTADPVVLPNTTSLLQERFCEAGSLVTMSWLGGVGHMKAGEVAGPGAVAFLWARFSGEPATSTCGEPPAVLPYGG